MAIGKAIQVGESGVELHHRVVGVLDKTSIGGTMQLLLHSQSLLQ